MTQAELVQALALRTGLSPAICEAYLNEWLNLIRETLRKGESVTIEKFGAFEVYPAADGSPRVRFNSDEALREAVARAKTSFQRVGGTMVMRVDKMQGVTQSPAPPSDRMPAQPKAASAPPAKPQPMAPLPNATSMLANAPAPAAKPAGKKALDDFFEDQPVAKLSDAERSEIEREVHALDPDDVSDAVPEEEEPVPVEVVKGQPGAPAKKMDDAGSATELSNLAQDLLGLEAGQLEQSLGLGPTGKRLTKGQQITFPVQISLQARRNSGRYFRPSSGDERRSLKDLALKNFFLSLGSVVRDRTTREPLIVYDVADRPGPEGERYQIRMLKVKGTGPSQAKTRDGGHTLNLTYEDLEFDPEKHEVLMAIDQALGPRVHGFEIGGFLANDRRERAEVCLAQEYEKFQSELER